MTSGVGGLRPVCEVDGKGDLAVSGRAFRIRPQTSRDPPEKVRTAHDSKAVNAPGPGTAVLCPVLGGESHVLLLQRVLVREPNS